MRNKILRLEDVETSKSQSTGNLVGPWPPLRSVEFADVQERDECKAGKKSILKKVFRGLCAFLR